ncbi:hypothetical protein LXA43DRAFT_1103502 [Ganoderma leucocontextum]|nr:hypothetical protein LXA43DRAFT_1103502 [Ganoderma leucocontextum]
MSPHVPNDCSRGTEGDYARSYSNANVVHAARGTSTHLTQSSLPPHLKQPPTCTSSTIEADPAAAQSSLAQLSLVLASATSHSSSPELDNGKDGDPEPATHRSVPRKPKVKKRLVLPVGLAKAHSRPSGRPSHRRFCPPPKTSTVTRSAGRDSRDTDQDPAFPLTPRSSMAAGEHAVNNGRVAKLQYARSSLAGPSFLTRLFRRPTPSTASPFINFKERRPLNPVVTMLHAEAVMTYPKHRLPPGSFLRDTTEDLDSDDSASDPENTIQVSPRLATIKLAELARRTPSTQAHNRRRPPSALPQQSDPPSAPYTSQAFSLAAVDTQAFIPDDVEPLHWAMPTSPKTTRRIMIAREIPAPLRIELLRHRMLGHPARRISTATRNVSDSPVRHPTPHSHDVEQDRRAAD